MRAAGLLGALFCCAVFAAPVRAQTTVDAKWIWLDDGISLTDTKPGKAWFRREVRAEEPSTGVARVACDDKFTLWVNGQKIGSGEAKKPYRFNLNGIVERGPNVVAVEVDNAGGKAGLLVDGEVRGQGGGAISFDTGPEWMASTKQPAKAWLNPKNEDASFKPVRVIGPHAQSAWKDIVFGESYLDR